MSTPAVKLLVAKLQRARAFEALAASPPTTPVAAPSTDEIITLDEVAAALGELAQIPGKMRLIAAKIRELAHGPDDDPVAAMKTIADLIDAEFPA